MKRPDQRNALAGFEYVHGTYLAPKGGDEAGATPYGYTPEQVQAAVANAQANCSEATHCQVHGDTRYITLPAKYLPIMQPLIDLGAATGTSAVVIPLVDLVALPEQRQFGLDKRETLPRYCRECEVRFVCNGGCPKDRFIQTPDGEPGLNYLCEGYRAFFNHIDQPMRVMAAELRAGRAPANIMHKLAQEEAALQRLFATAGRNEPCPCGSGKKFKQCHGRQGTVLRA